MSKRNITSLPHIAGDEITRLLSPLSQANLGRALASASPWFKIIFKDEIWLQTVSGLYYEYTSPPNPVLVGADLVKPYYGASRSPAYLALVLSDWGGDARYEKEKLFASFREQDYDFYEDLSEVRFK